MQKFYKFHALGNDYLVQDAREYMEIAAPELIERICHRNFGLGSDGILLGPLSSERADFGLRIFNPDGSEAEKSGNGLRIFVRFLFDQDLVKTQPFTIETPGGVVTCQVLDSDAASIQVEMGQVSFAMSHIPLDGPEEIDRALGETLDLGGESVTIYVADIGNPHCVVPLNEISEALAKRLGPLLEKHPRFPKKTNVQLIRAIDRNNLQIEIWERGAGYTLASGSSSSAAAAVAHRIGMCDRDITVHMPGGEIAIKISDDYAVRMTGPATRVGVMELDPEALK